MADEIQRAGLQILHRGDRKAAGDLWQDGHDLIFATKYGTPIEPGNLTRMVALRARRAGLRAIPPRNTRHTCISLLLALKVHPKVAQRILRHSQIAMTMEVYAEASEEAGRAAIRKLSDAMGSTGGRRIDDLKGQETLLGVAWPSGLLRSGPDLEGIVHPDREVVRLTANRQRVLPRF